MDIGWVGKKERMGRIEGVAWKHTLPYVKQIVGIAV